MKTLLFCVSELSLLDVNTNSMSLINVVTDMVAVGFPIALRLSAVALFEREGDEPQTGQANLLVSLNGVEIASSPWTFDFQGKRTVQSIAQFGGLPVSQSGKLRFLLGVGGAQSEWTIMINSAGPQVDLFSRAAAAQELSANSHPLSDQALIQREGTPLPEEGPPLSE